MEENKYLKFLQQGTKVNTKGVIILVIVTLILYGAYIFLLLKNKPESAYSSLLKEAKLQGNKEIRK